MYTKKRFKQASKIQEVDVPLSTRFMSCAICLACMWLIKNVTIEMLEYIFFGMMAFWMLRKPLVKALKILSMISLPRIPAIRIKNTGYIGEMKLCVLEKRIEHYELALKNAKAKSNEKVYSITKHKKDTLDKKRRLIIKERLKAI